MGEKRNQNGRTFSGSKEARIKNVARLMVEDMKEGKIPRIGEAMVRSGYSVKTAKSSSGKVSKSETFIKEMETLGAKLQGVQEIALDIIKKKKSKASFRDGVDALDKAVKMERLITGKSTENVAHTMASVLDGLEAVEITDAEIVEE